MVVYSHSIDSVYIHDSIYVREGVDTVFIDRWHTRWRDRVILDTVYERRTDTIYSTITEKVTEAPLQRGLRGWAVAAVLFMIIAIYMLFKTLLKR